VLIVQITLLFFELLQMTATLDELKELLLVLNKSIEQMNEKLDIICNNTKLNEEVLGQCNKMGSHIDFVENVYENMKHPLNYICGTINTMSNNKKICNEDIKN
jgi:hypothetical protein